MGRSMILGIFVFVCFPVLANADLVNDSKVEVSFGNENFTSLPTPEEVDEFAALAAEQDLFEFIAYEKDNWADMVQIYNLPDYFPVAESKSIYLVSGFFLFVIVTLKYRRRSE